MKWKIPLGNRDGDERIKWIKGEIGREGSRLFYHIVLKFNYLFFQLILRAKQKDFDSLLSNTIFNNSGIREGVISTYTFVEVFQQDSSTRFVFNVI